MSNGGHRSGVARCLQRPAASELHAVNGIAVLSTLSSHDNLAACTTCHAASCRQKLRTTRDAPSVLMRSCQPR